MLTGDLKEAVDYYLRTIWEGISLLLVLELERFIFSSLILLSESRLDVSAAFSAL